MPLPLGEVAGHSEAGEGKHMAAASSPIYKKYTMKPTR